MKAKDDLARLQKSNRHAHEVQEAADMRELASKMFCAPREPHDSSDYRPWPFLNGAVLGALDKAADVHPSRRMRTFLNLLAGALE